LAQRLGGRSSALRGMSGASPMRGFKLAILGSRCSILTIAAVVIRAAALTGNVPPPFLTEPSGLPGVDGSKRGTRMHHKFVVLDFDKPSARVYLGSYNFSEPADGDNGENLVFVRNRVVATSFMIEASRICDHYVLRVASFGPAGRSTWLSARFFAARKSRLSIIAEGRLH
jgi:phosphatidylserine/phosphatidylglycerophosphate/cardiolipin synthase-like enzyme